MNKFNYWKRGTKVRGLNIKVPANSTKPLVYFQIVKGCFDESPYWQQANTERSLFQNEVERYRKENPYANNQSVYECTAPRRAVYNRRIRKLEEAHIDYEESRLGALRLGLNRAFKLDIWEEATAQCTGGPMALYNLYEKLTIYTKRNK